MQNNQFQIQLFNQLINKINTIKMNIERQYLVNNKPNTTLKFIIFVIKREAQSNNLFSIWHCIFVWILCMSLCSVPLSSYQIKLWWHYIYSSLYLTSPFSINEKMFIKLKSYIQNIYIQLYEYHSKYFFTIFVIFWKM